MHFLRNSCVVGALKTAKRAKFGKIKARNIKYLIFRPIFHLEHYKSTNGLKKWFANKTTSKTHFLRNMSVIGAFQAARRDKSWAKWRPKIQNRKFCSQFSLWNTVNLQMDWENSYANIAIPKMYFLRHRCVGRVLKSAKTAKIWAKQRSKIQGRLLWG